MIRIFGAAIVLLAVAACDQYHRDTLRFGAQERGEERYWIEPSTSGDSLRSAITRSEADLGHYVRHRMAFLSGADGENYSAVLQRATSLRDELTAFMGPFSDQAKVAQLPDGARTTVYRIRSQLDALSKAVSAAQAGYENAREDSDESGMVLHRLRLTRIGNEFARLSDDVGAFCEERATRNDVPCSGDTDTRKQETTTTESSKAKRQAARAVPNQSRVIGNRNPNTENEILQSGLDSGAGTSFETTQVRGDSGPAPRRGGSEIGITWPETILDKNGSSHEVTEKFDDTGKVVKERTTINKGLNEELIRALSSTASVAQMRDLLTEPTFPGMLPYQRTVKLGCLPPPESAAFESTAKLKAAFQDKTPSSGGTGLQATAEAQFATAVVKLFEESERTLFLQYSLFRLCEMAINAPSGFRNVYPVIIHDIVRRTAEMNQLANKEAELRRAEEERTKQEAQKTNRTTVQLELARQEQANLKQADENRRRALVQECIAARTKDKPTLIATELKPIQDDCEARFPKL